MFGCGWVFRERVSRRATSLGLESISVGLLTTFRAKS